MHRFTTIIVHYEQPVHLAGCLSALQRCCSRASGPVIVVDNGSRHLGEVERVCARVDLDVRLVANRSNRGLARAANQALIHAEGDYLLHLNPDVRIHEGALEEMVRFMEASPAAGIAFPKLLNPDGSLQYSCRTYYDLPTVLLRRTVLGRVCGAEKVRKHLMEEWDHCEVRQVDWALGAAFLVRRGALGRSGLFDNRFFLYMEDVDLCLTMKERGWGVYYLPRAVMTHHHVRSSANKPFSRANWEHAKSFLRFAIKHGCLGPERT